MTQTAIDVFSTFGVAVLCIALGIMALAEFFAVLSRIDQLGKKPHTMAVRGVLDEGTWSTVHMAGSETFKLIGFTNSEGHKNRLPYELNGMVILEDPDKTRFLVRAKAIRMIVIAPDQNDEKLS